MEREACLCEARGYRECAQSVVDLVPQAPQWRTICPIITGVGDMSTSSTETKERENLELTH